MKLEKNGTNRLSPSTRATTSPLFPPITCKQNWQEKQMTKATKKWRQGCPKGDHAYIKQYQHYRQMEINPCYIWTDLWIPQLKLVV